jgi:hypothetical protein
VQRAGRFIGSGEQLRARRQINSALFRLHLHPGAGVAAVVHEVVHEPRVPAGGDSPPSGAEVSLRRHGVLLVAEVIADIREQLDQRDLQISGVALFPLRHQNREPVEHQPPETGIVLGQVIYLGFGQGLDGTFPLRLTVELGGASDLEREGDL